MRRFIETIIENFERSAARRLRGAFAASLLGVAVFMSSAMAQEGKPPTCVLANGRPAQEVAAIVGTSASTIADLQEVYAKIAAAATIRPDLKVCRAAFDVFAQLGSNGENNKVIITTDALALIGADKDVLARIMGHEFAHLRLGHHVQEALRILDAKEDARNEAEFIARRWGWGAVNVSAIVNLYRGQIMAFSREKELEADDLGFVFSTNAGYGLEAAEKITRLFNALGERAFAGYFDSHPGYLERLRLSGFLEKNTSMTIEARDLFAAEKWLSLGKLVNRWVADLPKSGAAYFYRGFWLDAIKKHPAFVSGAFEDSVARFEKPAVGAITQRMQYEANVAPLALCVALYKERRFRLSLSCTGMLSSEGRTQYLELTGWKTTLVVQKNIPEPANSLWTALDANGTIFLTNLEEYKNENYLKPVHSWSAPRLPRILGESIIPGVVTSALRAVFTDIFEAARAGSAADLYSLLKAGADLNTLHSGVSVLGVAVLAGNIENVEYLLLAGADPDALDGFRQTPREYALRIGRIDMIEAMRKAAVLARNNAR